MTVVGKNLTDKKKDMDVLFLYIFAIPSSVKFRFHSRGGKCLVPKFEGKQSHIKGTIEYNIYWGCVREGEV